jgi:hypothetical protein
MSTILRDALYLRELPACREQSADMRRIAIRTTILLAAILLSAGMSQAQYSEMRPAPPAPGPQSSGHPSGGDHYYDDDDYIYLPVEINPSTSTIPAAQSVTQGPATAYAHGDSNALIPSAFVAPRPKPAPRAQAAPPANNISGQFQQLVQARNAANSSPQTQPRLQVQNMSLADLARQVRAEKATAEKAKVKIKQDAQGHAILVQKNEKAAPEGSR